ncbi:MAG: hypothetical protein P8Y63_14605 [Deltaproteobacteria bacterium]
MTFEWKKFLFCLLMLSLSFLTACVPAMKTNSRELEERAAKLNTVLLLTPDITVNSLHAGDVKEKMPEWSEQSRELVIKAIEAELQQKGRNIKLLDPKTKYHQTVKEVKDLHLAVMQSIYNHAIYEPGNLGIFPQRIEHFDYTVGSVKKLLQAYRADGMLIVRGEDNISTTGRKALGVVKSLNPFSQGQQGGMTFLEATLTDVKGDVLWFKIKGNAGDYDLRSPEESSKFVKLVFEDFPGGDS